MNPGHNNMSTRARYLQWRCHPACSCRSAPLEWRKSKHPGCSTFTMSLYLQVKLYSPLKIHLQPCPNMSRCCELLQASCHHSVCHSLRAACSHFPRAPLCGCHPVPVLKVPKLFLCSANAWLMAVAEGARHENLGMVQKVYWRNVFFLSRHVHHVFKNNCSINGFVCKTNLYIWQNFDAFCGDQHILNNIILFSIQYIYIFVYIHNGKQKYQVLCTSFSQKNTCLQPTHRSDGRPASLAGMSWEHGYLWHLQFPAWIAWKVVFPMFAGTPTSCSSPQVSCFDSRCVLGNHRLQGQSCIVEIQAGFGKNMVL